MMLEEEKEEEVEEVEEVEEAEEEKKNAGIKKILRMCWFNVDLMNILFMGMNVKLNILSFFFLYLSLFFSTFINS